MTATQATWTIDPVHSRVKFLLDYMGFSTYRTGTQAARIWASGCRSLSRSWPSARTDMVALSETSSVQRNLRLLYGFSFFDPFMIMIPVILDNSSTHKTPAIHRWLTRHPRFHLNFTPTGASWINLVERWFAALTEKQLRRGVHRSTRELKLAIHRYVELTNAHPKPFIWTKIADEILASVARSCQRISNSGHKGHYHDRKQGLRRSRGRREVYR